MQNGFFLSQSKNTTQRVAKSSTYFPNSTVQTSVEIKNFSLYSPSQQASSYKVNDSRKSLKKIMPQEKKLMQIFQQKFGQTEEIQEAMNFSTTSDIFIEQEFQKTELEGDEMFEKDPPMVKRDAIKKSVVGHQTQLQFFNHHKQIDKITQENALFNIKDSLFTQLIKSQISVNLLPKKLGIIKQTGKDSVIDLKQVENFKLNSQNYLNSYYTLGDRYAGVFSKGISSLEISDKIKKLELMNNGLTDKGIFQILEGLSLVIEELNLSQNAFDNTKLGDANATKILESLKKLRILDLSNNKLTDECSTALAAALQRRFTGESGDKIAKALKDNSNLRVLDLSNNSLGLLSEEICCQSFSELFGKEESNILHIDLSNNRWNRKQMEIISQGINANRSIYGFHIENKFSIVDELGFLNMIETEQEQQQSQMTNLIGSQIIDNQGMAEKQSYNMTNENITSPSTRINGLLPLAIKSDAYSFSYLNIQSKQNNCWICQGWKEEVFVWKSGESGMAYQGPIYIHMNFDKYRPIPMVMNVPGYFILRRMCPPSHKLLYFFSTPECDTHAKDQPSIKNKTPFLKDIYFGTLKRDITIKYLNYKTVNRFYGSLFSSYFEPLHITVLPREELIFPEEKIRKKVWTKEVSVFSKYQQDTSSILERAMDADWNNSKIPKFVKDPMDRKKLFVILQEKILFNHQIYLNQELIKPHYEGIKALYKYYSSFSPIGDVWAISKLLFIEIFSRSGLVDNKTLKLADLEIKFIASKTMGKKGKGLIPERGMVRHEFFESIVRIAEEKYMINGDCTSYSEAVSHLLNDGFLKVLAENESPAQWRDERYWVQECDFCYKYYMQVLMSIFEQYENTIRDSLPKSKFLNLSEFRKIFTDTVILLDEKANERYINLAFNFSVQTQADEVYDERILQLHFIEFLEAIARCAEKFSLAPPKFPKQPDVTIDKQKEMLFIIFIFEKQLQLSQVSIEAPQNTNQEWTWEERTEQPLHKKIENLIKTIFLQALEIEERENYELSEQSIFDQKEINDAMTAPMKVKGKNIPFDGIPGNKILSILKITDALKSNKKAQK